jgi:hypothetical protein
VEAAAAGAVLVLIARSSMRVDILLRLKYWRYPSNRKGLVVAVAGSIVVVVVDGGCDAPSSSASECESEGSVLVNVLVTFVGGGGNAYT